MTAAALGHIVHGGQSHNSTNGSTFWGWDHTDLHPEEQKSEKVEAAMVLAMLIGLFQVHSS